MQQVFSGLAVAEENCTAGYPPVLVVPGPRPSLGAGELLPHDSQNVWDEQSVILFNKGF